MPDFRPVVLKRLPPTMIRGNSGILDSQASDPLSKLISDTPLGRIFSGQFCVAA
jgi:hypothetical protein